MTGARESWGGVHRWQFRQDAGRGRSFGRVAVIDDLSTRYRENPDGVDSNLSEGSTLDHELLDRAVTGADAIVHLAAIPEIPLLGRRSVASHLANAAGALMVIDAARRRGDPKVIVASSSSVHGANPSLPKHEALRTQPLSPYAVGKQATQSYALAYGHCYALPALAFGLFDVFGQWQAAGHAYAAAIPTWIDDAEIIGALLRRSTDDPANLAFGIRRTLLDPVASIGAALDLVLTCGHGRGSPGDAPHSRVGGRRMAAMVPGFEPVGFEEGLAETVAWFRTLPGYARA